MINHLSIKKGSTMAISALSIANFFVEKSLATGTELTPMKAIKLVYIAHGWNLAINDAPLIDEAVQAWKYGPVVPSVYSAFKSFRNGQITQMTHVIENFQILSPQVADQTTKQFLERVWNVYCKLSGWQLSAITHENDTPWSITWNKNGGAAHSGAIIPNELIAKHYKDLASKRPHAARN
jgi:uncharacterized phage-associated protein